MQNYTNPDKDIDLSGAFDSAIENRRQMAYSQSTQKKPNNKKRIYLFIIIISWIIIIFSGVYALYKKNKIENEREKIKQEIQLKIQQNAKIKRN